ncbi:bifunctional transcriptional activator/DNA repair enzyme AdaA [Acinetobacter sp. WZC-1]|uniref:bifunctional transcriptional activator/DNA repair enzyme AdaA n=1 Tax=Acinetobacter sp. WZC-1 TaxID=3459034 RepID=UPI00403DFDBE
MRSQMNYDRIATAIDYIQRNFQQQPGLEEIAEYLHLSPAHFQRLFTEWAGTSPKKFLQYISLAHARKMLRQEHDSNVLDAAYATGLSSSSRLHDLFIQIEGMTPAEYKNGGKNLQISYDLDMTPFGPVLIASTSRGICHLAFIDDAQNAIEQLRQKFPAAEFQQQSDDMQQHALQIFRYERSQLSQIKLHLKGTDFQLKVWESLLRIPMGQLMSYGDIAQQMGHPKAFRAVGTAIGNNPVAFLIPCHRVIQATGTLGAYRWGSIRKTAIIGWEGGHLHAENS